MVAQTSQFLCLAVLMPIFLIFNSLTYAQEGDDKGGKLAAKTEANPSDDSFKAVTDFCNQRSTSQDRAFCVRVLKSNPRSVTATDNVSLLKVAIDLAVGNAKKTREFFITLTTNNDTKPPLVPVLNECISAYDGSITQLLLITQDLEDDPPMASYDAHMANEELLRCQNSLKTSEIDDDSILSRHKIATDYGRLCEEISKSS